MNEQNLPSVCLQRQKTKNLVATLSIYGQTYPFRICWYPQTNTRIAVYYQVNNSRQQLRTTREEYVAIFAYLRHAFETQDLQGVHVEGSLHG